MVCRCVHSLFIACVLLTASLRAEGLLYQLPADGTWAKFEVIGKAVEPNGKETTATGTLTLSSVGTAEVEGEKCRWIEVAYEGQRNDQPFTAADKLLIPEKHLAKGEEPLEHVLAAWSRHSERAGGASSEVQDVQNPDSRGGKYVRGNHLSPFLHGPYKKPRKLDKALVETKLGRRECLGITAEELTAGKVSTNSTYVIRLHEDAPFGVVTWEAEAKFEQDDKPLFTMKTTARLIDFGKNAKSTIPQAK